MTDGLTQFVSRDLQWMPVGVAEVDRVRNTVILEVKSNSSGFQLSLSGEEIFPICTKREMQHADRRLDARQIRRVLRGK